MTKIKFERKFSLKNGNKVNKKNWHKVVAISNRPCTNVLGVPEIERIKAEEGAYYEKWALKYEPANSKFPDVFPAGYIFRELNHNGGISGRHSTYREAIWNAIKSNISVYLEQ